MASWARRIGHVGPGIAPSITTSLGTFKANSPRKIGERQYKLSLRLAEPSRARALKNRQLLAACRP